jgi:hypothetical protein
MVNYVQRARDVRALIKDQGIELGLIKAVERLAEDNEMLRQEQQQVIKAMNKMADIVSNIATVGERLKHDWEAVRQSLHPDNEASYDIEDKH